VVVSTPGKLILMGEHAVVYGHPALSTAVNLRLRVRLQSAVHGDVDVWLTESGHRERVGWAEIESVADEARRRWLRHAAAPAGGAFGPPPAEDPAFLVKVALGEARAFLGERHSPGLSLEISSEIPVGSGFGSSAALGLAVLDGYLAFRGVSLPAVDLQALALEVERRQHGRPSGVDGATVLRGGMIWAERDEAGDLCLEPVVGCSPHLESFRVYDTGTPSTSTGAVVDAVHERWNRDRGCLEPLLAEMGEATRRFRRVLLDPGGSGAEVVALVRRFEFGLEALGVVPSWVQGIVREVEARGGAAKISGAGTASTEAVGSGKAKAGAGGLLVFHPEPDRIAGWECLAGVELIPVRLSAAGGLSGHRREDV